jgi:hypothetical protein
MPQPHRLTRAPAASQCATLTQSAATAALHLGRLPAVLLLLIRLPVGASEGRVGATGWHAWRLTHDACSVTRRICRAARPAVTLNFMLLFALRCCSWPGGRGGGGVCSALVLQEAAMHVQLGV